jgi:PLP dependent protein
MGAYIKDNLNTIIDNIEKQTLLSGRKKGIVKLLAVSKTYSNEAIMEAYEYGQRMFGENKIQELEVKVPALPDDIEWHLIGHLQSNKVAKAVELVKYIHSVDSVKLINKIDRIACEKNRRPKIFLEINISGEESKFGVTVKEAEDMVQAALNCRHLELVGFMTMAPFSVDEGVLQSVFSSLRNLRDLLEKKYSIELPELSMGMTSDYDTAINEGSTIVRIGTAIFGKRNYI